MKPSLGFSHFVIQTLRIPRHSHFAYLIHLTTAFAISAFFHVLSLSVVCPGYLELRDLIVDMTVFFLPQPIGTMVETLAKSFYSSLTSPKETIHDGEEEGCRGFWSFTTLRNVAKVANRCIGYVWVLCWFVFTGWWFVKAYVAIRVLEWPLPYSFMEKIFIPGK
jgi:hypothetical protein